MRPPQSGFVQVGLSEVGRQDCGVATGKIKVARTCLGILLDRISFVHFYHDGFRDRNLRVGALGAALRALHEQYTRFISEAANHGLSGPTPHS